jgi:hypothetical protein
MTSEKQLVNLQLGKKDEGGGRRDEKKTGGVCGCSSSIHPSSFILHPFLGGSSAGKKSL